MTAYVCTGCAGSSVEINRAHPSIDDRYPLGHCLSCTPWPKPKPNPMKPTETIQQPRKTIALIRRDLFDTEDFNHRQKVAEMRRLANKLHSKSATKMSKAELEKAAAAVRWLLRESP